MTSRLESGLTMAVASSIVLMAWVIVRREFFPPEPIGPPPPPPIYVHDWRAAVPIPQGQALDTSRVILAEFADLQCPGCRGYQRIMNELADEFDGQLEIVFVHFPLVYHQEAKPMARGAECARQQGRFADFVDKVYQAQESLRVKSPWQYARTAGVVDSMGFQRCLADSARTDIMIDAGLRAGAKIKVQATPTILINGWMFEGAPSKKALKAFIQESLKGGHAPPPRSLTQQ